MIALGRMWNLFSRTMSAGGFGCSVIYDRSQNPTLWKSSAESYLRLFMEANGDSGHNDFMVGLAQKYRPAKSAENNIYEYMSNVWALLYQMVCMLKSKGLIGSDYPITGFTELWESFLCYNSLILSAERNINKSRMLYVRERSARVLQSADERGGRHAG